MTNQELFEQYNTEKWVIEQNLCFLLQKYWEEHGKKAIEQAKNGYITNNMPYNPVSFVKEFMKEETICDVKYAEKSKMNTLKNISLQDAQELISTKIYNKKIHMDRVFDLCNKNNLLYIIWWYEFQKSKLAEYNNITHILTIFI